MGRVIDLVALGSRHLERLRPIGFRRLNAVAATLVDARLAARSPVVLLCAGILFINYMDRGTLSMAAPMLQQELGLDYSAMGILLSAFFWSYTLMQVPMGWLAERYGGHRVLAIGLGVWAMATMLTGAVHSFGMLLMLRVLLGFGESTGFPCMSKVLAQTVPPNGLGFANGIVGFAYLFGPAVGSWAGGHLIAAYGWRMIFFVFGAASLIWLIPWARVAPTVRAQHAASAVGEAPKFREILKTPALWGTGLGLFSSNYIFYFMLMWLPSYLEHERGFSTIEMGNITAYSFLLNALASLVAGWGIDRLIARGMSATFIYKGIMAVAQVGIVACIIVMALGAKPAAIVCLFVYQLLCGASSPGIYAISQILAGPKASGRWVGVQNSMGGFAGVVSPWATGLIIDATHSFTNALLLAAGVASLGLVGWVWMLPPLRELRWTSAKQRDGDEAAARC